ncbi:MAG: asparagine synthase-related protein [Balneolales bacterium]
MAGLYGIYSPKQFIPKGNYGRMFGKGSAIVTSENTFKNFTYGRKVLDKLLEDRVLYELDDIIIGYEGINFDAKENARYLYEEYKNKGISFVDDIDGRFSGFIYDKISGKLHVFTDHLSTKSVYYYFSKAHKIFIFSSELKLISNLLRELKIPISYDHDGIACLLSIGYMLDDLTLISEVKKLTQGNILTFDPGVWNLKTRQFFSHKIHPQKMNLKDAINRIDEAMTAAVLKEWEKDRQYNFQHLAFLSGGLDSRVNVLIANQLGYRSDLVHTFAQSNSGDHIIAREIADHYNFKQIFHPLDSGSYLAGNIYEYVEANDGLTVYNGAAHMYWALSKLDLQPYGLAHTGHIGGGVFGVQTKKTADMAGMIRKQSYVKDQHILNRISIIDEVASRYQELGYEMFAYEQRRPNAMLNGDRMISHMIDLASPFFDKTLLNLFKTIPVEYKSDQRIYFKWFNEKHPYISKFRYDSSGIKPKNAVTTKYARKLRAAYKKLRGSDKNNMNPFEKWYSENPAIPAKLESTYRQYLESVRDKDIKALIQYTYNLDGVQPKISAVTALVALHLHFEK